MTIARPATQAAGRFRRLFPMLASTTHLGSCSLGARSTALDEAMDRMLEAMSAGAAAWSEFEQEAERCRRGFAALIGAAPDQIALVANASTGAYQAVSTLSLTDRRVVVAPEQEFPSISHVWLAQRCRSARVEYVDVAYAASAEQHVAAYASAIDGDVALVSVPLATYTHGTVLPVAEITRLAHEREARVFVDAYQAVGVLPVDVTELDCDFLVAGCQKYLLGLPGVAFLYVRDGAATDLDPVLTGWFGRADPFAFDPHRLDFAGSARRMETGTPAVPALYAANAGMGLLADLDADAVHRHVRRLTTLAVDRLTAQGERLETASPDRRGAHVALADSRADLLAQQLALRGVGVSPRGSVVRLAFHYYNDESDVDALCEAVRQLRRL